MLNIKKTLTKILPIINALKTDYIIEEGTDANGWYVRKWNSGFMEASITVTNGSWGNSQSLSGIIRQELTGIPTFPPFVSYLTLHASGTGSGSWIVAALSSQNVPQVFCQRVSGTSIPIKVVIELTGKWKLGG